MTRVVQWLRALWRGWRGGRSTAACRPEPVELDGGWSAGPPAAARPTDTRPRCSLCLLTGARYPLAEMLKRRRDRSAADAPRGDTDV